MSRTDTELLPSAALTPLPQRLSPRTERRPVRWVTSIVLAAAGLLVGLLLAAAVPVLAFFVPQPMLVAGIVVLVGAWIVYRSLRDQGATS